MHFPEKQFLSQDLDADEDSAWSTRCSMINIPKYVFKTSRALFLADLVQVHRCVPPASSMMDAECQSERLRARPSPHAPR